MTRNYCLWFVTDVILRQGDDDCDDAGDDDHHINDDFVGDAGDYYWLWFWLLSVDA